MNLKTVKVLSHSNVRPYPGSERCSRCGAVVNLDDVQTLLLRRLRLSDGRTRLQVIGCNMCPSTQAST